MRLLQLNISPDHGEQFKAFYIDKVYPLLHKMQGCLFAGLIKGGADGTEIISITFWETQEQADSYEKSSVFTNLLSEAKPFLSESNEWKVQLSDKMELEYAPVQEEPIIKKYTAAINKEDYQKAKIAGTQMYVRIVSLKIQEDKLEEFKNLYSELVMKMLKETPGCKFVFLTESMTEKNEFLSVTIWDSKEDAYRYENSGKFEELTNRIKHTFSQFYLWKMALEKEYSAKIKTTDDLKVESYNLVTGKSFL
jgi:heme-degrading monooxygenase HmoA